MSSVNKVILVGNVGKEPETKQVGSGNTLAYFSVATSEKFQDRSGEWQERTEWHNVTCWGKTAENASRFVTKGMKIYVEGKIQTDKYQDQNGEEKQAVKIVASRLVYLSSDRKSDAGGYKGSSGYGNRNTGHPGGFDGF